MTIMKLRCFLFSLPFCNFLLFTAILFILPLPCPVAFFLAAVGAGQDDAFAGHFCVFSGSFVLRGHILGKLSGQGVPSDVENGMNICHKYQLSGFGVDF